jgi:hypothetical protein
MKATRRTREMVYQRLQLEAQPIRPSLSDLLTVSDVAVILSVSEKTVDKLVREQKLACVKVAARARWFNPEEIRGRFTLEKETRTIS